MAATQCFSFTRPRAVSVLKRTAAELAPCLAPSDLAQSGWTGRLRPVLGE